MPRRSELLEEERNYRLVKREKEESGALVKQVLRFLFSQVGVVILGVITAVLGNVYNQINSEVSGLPNRREGRNKRAGGKIITKH